MWETPAPFFVFVGFGSGVVMCFHRFADGFGGQAFRGLLQSTFGAELILSVPDSGGCGSRMGPPNSTWYMDTCAKAPGVSMTRNKNGSMTNQNFGVMDPPFFQGHGDSNLRSGWRKSLRPPARRKEAVGVLGTHSGPSSTLRAAGRVFCGGGSACDLRQGFGRERRRRHFLGGIH